MRRFISTCILCVATVINAVAAFSLTATKVTIEDVTVDKANFYITVNAHTATGDYEVDFDVWPQKQSAIGSFSAADGTIKYTFSKVHKSREGETTLDWTYLCQPESNITLTITKVSEGQCALSGSIQAERQDVMYTYNISEFVFDYSEDAVVPDPDPYRFEPAEVTTVDFQADVISFREREGYIEVTLNEMQNETYDWIELRLLSDTLDMPAGTYSINDSGDAGTLTASKGYLGGTKGDDPSYVAIRADKENWGQYTPYYLVSGSLAVSFNDQGDTITIAGEAKSYNGSTILIHAKGYNMLYVAEYHCEPENVLLAIDTVLVTYMSDLSDSLNNAHYYTFNFFSSKGDFPNVLVDVVLDKPMALTEGTYTLEDKQLKGLELFQNQTDFNAVFFGGEPYVFTSAALKLAEAQGGMWTYSMVIHDEIGSEYRFSIAQDPRIVFYPTKEEEIDPEDQPYADEQREKAAITAVFDSIVWQATTVSKDGVLDIMLTQRQADVSGLRAYLHLGMYTDVEYPAAGTYPVNSSEESGSFSASLGRYGNVLIPCYLALLDDNGWAHAVWYITGGSITISYDEQNQPLLTGDCSTHFGSTIHFVFTTETEGIQNTGRFSDRAQTHKILRNGQVIIVRDGKEYSIFGIPVAR